MLDDIEIFPPSMLVFNHLPDIHTYTNALYVPKRQNNDPSVGVYSEVGYLIPQAALFHCNPPRMKGHRAITDLDLCVRYESYPRAIYVGHLDLHYGHTLTEFIPRLWALKDIRRNNEKLLFHSTCSAEEVFSCRWLLELIALCGLCPEDFISFDVPTRISKLIVPNPAFCENGYAYDALAHFCASVGDVARAQVTTPYEGPIYLSRSRLSSGTWGIANEDELCEALAERGFSIIYPETLPVAEQMALFNENTIVSGLIGSAFHNSIFSRNAASLCLVEESVCSSFLLMDAVSGNEARYVRFPCHHGATKPGFTQTQVFDDPQKLASDIEAACAQKLDEIRQRTQRATEVNNIYREAAASKLRDYRIKKGLSKPQLLPPPEGLLSLTQDAYVLSTSQSSICEWSKGSTQEEDSRRAISGECTGDYSFHTNLDSHAWWSVTFRRSFAICQVRIYNRLSEPYVMLRAAPLVIEILNAEGKWVTVFTYDKDISFGGADGFPLEWEAADPPVTTSVRIRLLKEEYLHLDQIEIFGLPADYAT